MLYAILARDKNNLIGNGASLPWKDDESTKWDLASFKRLTSGNIVFMGYRTFFGFEKPLPDRINVVEDAHAVIARSTATKQSKKLKNGNRLMRLLRCARNDVDTFLFTPSLDDFLETYKNELSTVWKSKKIFIIGGAATIQKYKDKIDFLYLTTFYDSYKGDVFLPEDFLDGFKFKSQIESHENGKIEEFVRQD